jgi:glycolate oxidase
MTQASPVSLERALVEIDRACGGDAVVRDPDILESVAGDESETPRRRPEALVRAASTRDVAAVLKAASKHGVPVTPRGAGTGRVGGAVPVHGGIVLSTESMRSIVEVHDEELVAVVEPGVATGALHAAVEDRQLFYPPDPNSLATCTMGGNLACNAGGPRAFKYGVTGDFVLSLEVVTAEGSVLAVGKPTVKGVTGYDLASLIVGSEGTLGVITRAKMRLLPKPESVRTLLVFVADDASVGRGITGLLRRGIVPRCVELVDSIALDLIRRDAGLAIPAGAKGMLLVELDGPELLVDREVERTGNAFGDEGALEILTADRGSERERLWSARRELSRTLRTRARFKLSEDVVVPRTRIFDLLRTCRELSERHGVVMPTYGHAGDGNLHVNFLWDHERQRPDVELAIHGLFEATIALGGTLSGEHGIGVLKAPFLPMEQSPELIALQRKMKSLFDPRGILNPGKVFEAGTRPHGNC